MFFAMALVLGLTSCNDGPDYGDALFITGTLSSPNVRFAVDGESSLALTVSSTTKVSDDIEVTLTVDPSQLGTYNTSTGRNQYVQGDGRRQPQYGDHPCG